MQIISDTIKKVAEIKAKSALESAEKIAINEIVFEEGVQPGEVELNSGIEKLCETLGGKIQVGYVNHGTPYVRRVKWFRVWDVCFFEEHYLSDNENLPLGTTIVESRGYLYASM